MKLRAHEPRKHPPSRIVFLSHAFKTPTMNKNAIIVLVLAAAGLGAAAVLVGGRSSAPASAPRATGEQAPLLLPALASKAADITSVQLLRDGKTLRINRTPAGWVLADKGNYPAQPEPITRLVRGLLEARVLETKTSDPALYERLSVQDPTASSGSKPDGASVSPVLVSLLGSNDAPLAKVILGKAQQSATGDASQAASFARQSGATQSLLISGTFTAPIDPMQWVERSVLELERSRFAKAIVQQPKGPDGALPAPLVVVRKSEQEESYLVENLPEGRELKDTTTPQRVVTPLASVTIDDVMPASGVDFSQGVQTTLITFDGIVFRVQTVDHPPALATAEPAPSSPKPWVTISVSYDASLDTQAPKLPAANTDPVAAKADADAHAAALASRAQQQTTFAAGLHNRLSPWAFALPALTAEQLRATMESLLKPLPGSDPPTADGTPMPEIPGDAPIPPMLQPAPGEPGAN